MAYKGKGYLWFSSYLKNRKQCCKVNGSNSIQTINNALNEYLMLLKTWLDENILSLNVAKTQSLLIGSRYKTKALEQPDSPKLSLAFEDELISLVATTEYLGLQVDQYLN